MREDEGGAVGIRLGVLGQLVGLRVQERAVVRLHDDDTAVQGAEALVGHGAPRVVELRAERPAHREPLGGQAQGGADAGGREPDPERHQPPRTARHAHHPRSPPPPAPPVPPV